LANNQKRPSKNFLALILVEVEVNFENFSFAFRFNCIQSRSKFVELKSLQKLQRSFVSSTITNWITTWNHLQQIVQSKNLFVSQQIREVYNFNRFKA
jgi:hypothetical protein